MFRLPTSPPLWVAVLLCSSPLARAQCKLESLTPSDARSAQSFGASIAVAGRWTFVGAPGDDEDGVGTGAAYVFEQTPAGWLQGAKLRSSDHQPGDEFGGQVVAWNDVFVVGASRFTRDAPGAAYVFERGATWTESQQLVAWDGSEPDSFGEALALQGDTLMVGALRGPGPTPHTGAVYVFERGADGWSAAQKLVAGDAGEWHYFGMSVALDGDRALVGAAGHDGRGELSGAAYVFERTGSGWVETAKLVGSGVTTESRFGGTVALSGKRLLVGARDGVTLSGRVFAYELRGSTWVELVEVSAGPDAGTLDSFGRSLDLRGDRALVGAYGAGGFNPNGVVHRFQWREQGWQREGKLEAVGADGTQFGFAVVGAGEVVWVGAILDDEGGAGAGKIYRFHSPAFALPFCFGLDCPCGNDDPTAGCANLSGRGARMTSCGSSSVTADDLVLRITNVPIEGAAQVQMGRVRTRVPFGDGITCLAASAGTLYRFPLRPPDSLGTVIEGPGIVAYSIASFPPSGHISAGRTWAFQTWYVGGRVCSPSGPNFSNALAVTFRP